MEEERGQSLVFANDFERRVWVASFEAECAKEKCSQLAALNADARLSLFRAMDPMEYANRRDFECDEPQSESLAERPAIAVKPSDIQWPTAEELAAFICVKRVDEPHAISASHKLLSFIERRFGRGITDKVNTMGLHQDIKKACAEAAPGIARAGDGSEAAISGLPHYVGLLMKACVRDGAVIDELRRQGIVVTLEPIKLNEYA